MTPFATYAWEPIPGYPIDSFDWASDWYVVLIAVGVLALVLGIFVFALGFGRMSKEEREAYKSVKQQAKQLKGKEKKDFINSQPKGTKTLLRWRFASFFFYPVFSLILVVSLVATPLLSTYGSTIWATLFYTDQTVDSPSAALVAAEATENVVTIEKEGAVLMRNDKGLLPLNKETTPKINIFGANAFGIFYGNGGSGEFATDYKYANGREVKCVKLETAITEAGFEYNPYLHNLCKNYASSGNKTPYSIAESDYNMHASIATFGTTGRYEGIKPKWLPYEHEPKVAAYEQAYSEINGKSLIDQALEYSDTALFCISRYGTEQYDLPYSSKMDELRLTGEEYDLLTLITDNFDKVIVLLNTPGPMYINDLDDLGIDTILYVGHPGLTGTRGIASILSGETNPSGRLVDTWPVNLAANPANETFGRNTTRFSGGKAYNFANYYEGIYVGYRYYTTRAETDPEFVYDDEVYYSFGHGLSYTTFDKWIESSSYDKETQKISITFRVENTGTRAGKYVAEFYSNPPYTGKIEKASRNLVSYLKSNVLDPEENKMEQYTINMDLRELASWDSTRNCYVAEKGEYQIIMGEDCYKTSKDKEGNDNVFKFTLEDDVVFETSYQTGAKYSELFADLNRGAGTTPNVYLSRGDWEGTFTKHADIDTTWGNPEIDNNNLRTKVYGDNEITEEVNIGQTLDEPITIFDMKNAAWDDPRWPNFLSQLSEQDMKDLVGKGEFGTPKIASIQKEFSLEGDGPASCLNSGTGHPSGVILASTWWNEAAKLFGKSCAKEGTARGLTGWYAPGMNIHRSPYAGRAFEYYSEDPLIAGNMGGYTAKGAMEMGVYTFAKHLGLNEQETNRGDINVFASEQAIREIYLRPFEIYTDLGGVGMMSAFSFMGTTWSGASKALLTDLLRTEWGFKGSVVTDYNNASMVVTAGIRAGNDEWLIDAQNMIRTAFTQSPHDMRYYFYRASKNILYSLVHSNAAWQDADFEAIGVENPRNVA
ncbi:MAG: glycoside hydrolase family 3 C-terminal domain-containing protein [Bacilli bacterium]|nr:glycoside hydrolase family 3 C-terminal domain-containing protein [Bacilli bacterium]